MNQIGSLQTRTRASATELSSEESSEIKYSGGMISDMEIRWVQSPQSMAAEWRKRHEDEEKDEKWK